MSQTNGHLPPDLPEDDPKAGTGSRDSKTPDGEGADPANLAKMSEPISGGSLISWAELLRQSPRPSDDEVNIGSLPEIQIDAVSDNDLIKHLEREAGLGSSRKLLISGSSKKIIPPPLPKPESARSNGANPPDVSKHDEWYKQLPEDGGSSVDLMNAAKAALKLTDDNSINSRLEDSDVLSAALQADDGESAVNLGKEPRSAPITPAMPNNLPLSPRASTSPRPRPASLGDLKARKPKNSLNAWLGGTIGGVAGAGLVATGLWATGELHLGRFKPALAQNPPGQASAKPSPEQAQRFLVSGDPEKALAMFGECESTPAVLAGRGQARWLGYLRQQKSKHLPLAENDEAVGQARKDLIASKSAEGLLWLGLINESLGNFAKAREAYDNGRNQYPERAKLFAAARARLDALTNHRDKKVAVLADPQLGFALSLILLQLPEDAGGPSETGEAGFDFWEAVRLSRDGDYVAAREALVKARAAHEQRRNVVLRQGLNPDSDPREEIFLHSCDQLLAWWDFQAKLNYAGFKLDGQTPAEVVEALLANQKKFDSAMKSLGDKLKIEKPDDVVAALDGVVSARMKAEAEVRKAQSELLTVETALKSAQTDREKAETAARKIKADLESAETALKTAQTGKEKAEAEVRKIKIDLQTAESGLKSAQAERQKAEADLRKAQADVQTAEAAMKSAQTDRTKALADFRKAQADLAASEANFKTATTERKKAEADVARIQNELQTAESSLKTAQAERLKAENELKSAKEEASKFAEDLKAVKVEAAKVADQLKAAKLTAAEAANELKAKSAEAAKIADDLKSAKLEVVKANDDAKVARQDATKAGADLKAVRLEAAKAVDELKASRKQAADSASELRLIKQSISKSDSELISTKKELIKVNESLTAIQKSAAEEASRAKSRFDELAAKEADARKSLQLLTVKESDLRKALAEVTAARRAADDQIQMVRTKLQKARLVGDQATPAELAKALDTLVSVNPAVKNAEIAELKALLEQARSPRQMLDLWPVLLHGEAPRELAALALADADAASAKADATTKAKAEAVKALALAVREDFAGARAALELVAKQGELMSDASWAERIRRAHAELSDARAISEQVRRWLDRGDSARALDLANRGLKAFPSENFARDHAKLLALRGEVEVKLNRFDDAQRDADAATDAGQVAQGRFVSGYIAERRGQWAKAADDYRAAFDAAGEDSARIRLALARVLAGPSASDADLEQASKLAEQCAIAGLPEGHLVKARVLYRQKKPAQAVEAALLGLKGLSPAEYSDDWLTVYRSVPVAAPRIDVPAQPDPALAEKLFSYGLKAYYNRSFGDAESELLNAVRNNNQDARYLYFLGLARLQQGKIEAAQDDFRQASALERQGLPDSRTLNGYFERIQGPERQLVNRYRP